jgi:hypothetical protein
VPNQTIISINHVAILANAKRFFLLVNVFMPSFLQIYLQLLGTLKISLTSSGVFSKYLNLLNETVALTSRPIGIYILTGNPFLRTTSLSDSFFMKSLILYIELLPPIDNVLRTVRKLLTYRGNSLDNHKELSTVLVTFLDILLLIRSSCAASDTAGSKYSL